MVSTHPLTTTLGTSKHLLSLNTLHYLSLSYYHPLPSIALQKSVFLYRPFLPTLFADPFPFPFPSTAHFVLSCAVEGKNLSPCCAYPSIRHRLLYRVAPFSACITLFSLVLSKHTTPYQLTSDGLRLYYRTPFNQTNSTHFSLLC